jgi:hypothetical protein
MKKSSERLVVFVTPAQKRAIAATAQGMGISVSELLRRAVLAFDATGGQVRAARIVDSMRAPQPDALNETLRRVAQTLPAARRVAPPVPASDKPAQPADPDIAAGQPVPVAATVARALAEEARVAQASGAARQAEGEGRDARLDEEAVARVTACKAASDALARGSAKPDANPAHNAAAPQEPPRARTRAARDDDTALPDDAEPANGRFA